MNIHFFTYKKSFYAWHLTSGLGKKSTINRRRLVDYSNAHQAAKMHSFFDQNGTNWHQFLRKSMIIFWKKWPLDLGYWFCALPCRTFFFFPGVNIIFELSTVNRRLIVELPPNSKTARHRGEINFISPSVYSMNIHFSKILKSFYGVYLG